MDMMKSNSYYYLFTADKEMNEIRNHYRKLIKKFSNQLYFLRPYYKLKHIKCHEIHQGFSSF